LSSRPRRSAIDTSLHPTRRHIPREAGALHPVEEASTARRPCRPVPPTTTIRFHEDWCISFRKAGIPPASMAGPCPAEPAPSSNERDIPHQRALVAFRRTCSGCAARRAAHRPNDVQSPPWASILPCRDLKRCWLDVEGKELDAVVVHLERDTCKGDSEAVMVMKIEGSKSRLC
jgi:hypothetical protein